VARRSGAEKRSSPLPSRRPHARLNANDNRPAAFPMPRQRRASGFFYRERVVAASENFRAWLEELYEEYCVGAKDNERSPFRHIPGSR